MDFFLRDYGANLMRISPKKLSHYQKTLLENHNNLEKHVKNLKGVFEIKITGEIEAWYSQEKVCMVMRPKEGKITHVTLSPDSTKIKYEDNSGNLLFSLNGLDYLITPSLIK